MIKLVIVAPEKIPSRYQKGQMFIDSGTDFPERHSIECFTKAGILLELKTLFCRYVGQAVEISFLAPRRQADPEAIEAMAELLPAVPVTYLDCSLRFRHDRKKTFDPLSLPGRRFADFQPPWQEFREPPILLKSINSADYAYPATDEDEDEPDATQVTKDPDAR